jgi:eukaryotic-like serine/threonine-protein kinase
VTTPESLLPSLQQALVGRYVLERPLGRGGMGVVYLARELRLDRRVAIKLLLPERGAQPAARERFLREARTAGRLSHPNIVPIFTVDEVGAFVFFAMAYVRGETLGQRVRGSGPLGCVEAGRVLQAVALALGHAHEEGIVHRDVKADNILLEEATGRALVSDFGIAQVTSGGGTVDRRLLGTAEFMSPEQARGEAVDARSDIYSLGVVGFYALSGGLPFEGPDAMAVLAHHATDLPPPLASVTPGVPPRFAEVIDRCLAKDPAQRFPSAVALADAIGLVLQESAAPPVAVRAFVTRSAHLVAAARFYAGLVSVVLLLLGLYAAASPDRWARTLAVGVGALGAALPVGVLVARIRRLLRAGFGRRDLVAVLRTELTRRREELAFLYGAGPSGLERTLGRACYLALVAAAGGVAAMERYAWLLERRWTALLLGSAAGTAVLAAIAARARTVLRTAPAAERRLRFWSGPLGRWLFALARPHSQPRDGGPRPDRPSLALTPARPAP